MNTKANIIAARDAGPFKPAIVLGQGLPMEINGEPVAYFWKEMLPQGQFNDVNGKRFKVDAPRLDRIVKSFNRAKEKGFRPFLPAGSHKERQKNYGFIQDVRVNGRGALEGLHQFIGADAIREASRNKSSICTLENVTDEHGEQYEELIDHNAILPDPQISGLGDFVPFNPALAASRGQTISADVLELAASTQESEPMDISALRKAIGAAETVTDADVISQAAVKLGTIPTLEQAKSTAEADLATAKTELSRAKPAEGDFPAAIATGSVNILSREIELMAREGKISGEQATAAKALIGTGEKPNTLMLSRTGADHPAEGWLKILSLGKSDVAADGQQKSGLQVQDRQQPDHAGAMNLSRQGEQAQQLTTEQLKAAVEENLRRTQLGRATLAAKSA